MYCTYVKYSYIHPYTHHPYVYPCVYLYTLYIVPSLLLNIQYIFTDGHAYNHLSQFFNEEKDLKEIDWKAVNLVKWNDTEEVL